MLTALAISGYRSLREVIAPLKQLNVITGANGSGKSSLYRALRLLADTAQGRVIPSLAREGGLQSTLWAGRRDGRKTPVSLGLGFSSDEFSYAIDLGLPPPGTSSFPLDPEIKRECVWHGPILRPASMLVDRHGPIVRIRAEDGGWRPLTDHLSKFDSMMSHTADPRNAPELLALRESIRAWRFYDHFRTDPDAPARFNQVGTYTPILSNDGSDLASAVQTISDIGDRPLLAKAVDDAFPGAALLVESHSGRLALVMNQEGLLRPLSAEELSDGTLRYLLWIAALLTPRPPALMVLNEPETSLHPDLLPALSRLVASAAKHSQMILVTHSKSLIAALTAQPDCNSITLEKTNGQTTISGVSKTNGPSWTWPTR